MRRQTPAQRTPPADFSAGGATPPAAPVRGKHVRRVLRFSGWLLVGLCALVLAVGTLAALQHFVIIGKAQPAIQTVRWIGWENIGITAVAVVAVAVVLSTIPTLIATRRYLRV